LHEFSGGIQTRQVTDLSHGGHGHGARDATQGLQGFHHRVEAPSFDPRLEFLVEPLEAFGVFRNGADIFLKDDLLRWGRTDDLREPSEMGRVPGGLASVADIVTQHEGFETELGVFQIAAGICTRPCESATSFLFDLGDIDESAVPRAGQSGQLYGVSAIRFDSITGLFGNE
jgi:hypothetical protein